ncbi:unnamed protein product [Rotaria sordida]|uniref:Uncharacterized protein n=1 Tax=Rotaria sordida TaxID=392033 RepID=A0A815IZW7_9BILA|nr:unnamed protein product [Rotaria sordida]CAF1612750.1 unnamed protein product [Rotaria sordida]
MKLICSSNSMLIVNSLPQTHVIKQMTAPIDNDKSSNLQVSESIIDNNHNSISAIKIPLVSSRPILAVSQNHILVNEYTNKRKRLVLINEHLQIDFINSPIKQNIIDALWNDVEKKFFLLTETNIFTFNPNTKVIESISNIRSKDIKPFKCFTISNNQSSLLIAYDEWEPKFIDRWQKTNENNLWILSKRHSLNLTNNEFIGIILAINQDDCSNLAMTIYNNLTEQWRMELRHIETLICFKKILLPGSDFIDDYRMISMNNVTLDIKWLIHSSANSKIMAIDSKWNIIPINYDVPVYRMIQFKENNLIIRTKNRIDIHFFI